MSPHPRRQRQDPCPCGSRRSLAACCLLWEEALHRLVARLISFAATPKIRRLQVRAAALFWNTEAPLRRGKVKSAGEDLRFLEWFLQDYSPPGGGGPLLGEFADATVGLSPWEEDLLFASLLAPVRAYEVTEALGSRGVAAKDLLAGGESLVGPLGLLDLPIRSDILICRLLPLGRLTRPGSGLLVLPTVSREEMLAYLRVAYRLARPPRHLSLEDFLDGSAHLYHHFFLLRGRNLGGRAQETLRSAAFAPGEVTYRGRDTSRIRASLDRHPGLERGEETGDAIRYAWIDPDRDLARATVLMRPGEVQVSADTREDLDGARHFLERCLRGLIQPVGDRGEEAASRPRDEGSRTEARPRGAGFLARVLGRWPDTPSPRLHNRTPREACASRPGRQQVTGLLLNLERDFARQKRLGRAWADLTPLCEQLHLFPVASPGATR